MLGTCIGKYNRKYYYLYCIYIQIMSIFTIVKYLQLWKAYSTVTSELYLERQWQLIISFIIAVIAFLLTLFVGILNLISNNLCNGRTKTEYKYRSCKYHKAVPDPFDQGFWPNFYATFGDYGCINFFTLFLPISPSLYNGNKLTM